jgi:hypothetical protein
VNFPSTTISQLIRFPTMIHKPLALDYLLKCLLKKKKNSFFFCSKAFKAWRVTLRSIFFLKLGSVAYLWVFPSNLVPTLEGWWSLTEQLLVPLMWCLMWSNPTLLNQSSSLQEICIMNLFLIFWLSRQWFLLHQLLLQTWFHIHLWRPEALMAILKTLWSRGFKVYRAWKMQTKRFANSFLFLLSFNLLQVHDKNLFDLMHQIWKFVVIWFMVVHNNRCKHNMVMHNIILNFL